MSPNIPLADVFYRHDELERVFHVDESLFLSQGFTTDRAVELLGIPRERTWDGRLPRIGVLVPGEEHPWKSVAGTWRDHPDAADFEQNVSEYRKNVDSDPGRP